MQQDIIKYIIEEVIADEDLVLAADEDLVTSGLISSMGFFKLIGFVEEKYGIKIEPEDMVIEHFITVNAITALVEHRKSTAG